jgi:hypothetical protein
MTRRPVEVRAGRCGRWESWAGLQGMIQNGNRFLNFNEFGILTIL